MGNISTLLHRPPPSVLPSSQSAVELEMVEMININDFPDDILTHILSFLPFKQAFRTTILSHRWLPLFHSLAVLNIDDEGTNNKKYWYGFWEFMDKNMFSPHSQHITLKSFHLKCGYKIWDARDDSPSLNKWIEVAKQRGIEHLNLCYYNALLVPTTVFCCKTLVVLKLMDMHVENMYCCSVDLPSLKTLDLESVCFHDMENLMRLISGCPILENLKTSFVRAKAGVTVGGYYKPLPKLINADIHSFEVPLIAVCNVQFLSIYASRKIIHYEETNSYYNGLHVFGNLTELKLHWHFQESHDWNEVVKMLQNCPKLQTLQIIKALNSTTREDWKYPYCVPECVSSHLTKFDILQFEDFKADFQFAKYILQNARLLQFLGILGNPKPIEPRFVEDLFSCPRISPACTLYVSGFGFSHN